MAAHTSVEHHVTIQVEGSDVTVTCGAEGMVEFEEVEIKEHGTQFVPRVIEPSFGIDRLLYCTLENAFYVRPSDEQRTVLGITAAMAPFKCCVTGLSSNSQFVAVVSQLHKEMCRHGVSCRVDESTAAIGRRYSRIDEIGVPLVVTVDFDTAVDGSVTVRDRDSCEQIRVPLADVVQLVVDMTHGLSAVTWEEATARFPRFQGCGLDNKDE